MHHLPSWTDVDTDLQARATSCPHDLALQPPGHARLVENLQAIGGAIDMEMKAFAAPLTFDIQEEVVSDGRCWYGRSAAEQAPKQSAHGNLQRACDLYDGVEEVDKKVILRGSGRLSSDMPTRSGARLVAKSMVS
jgi:hypothetical protein